MRVHPEMDRIFYLAQALLQPGIFLHPRPKKGTLPPPNKKRKTEHKIEEISFDDSARADYLMRFHQRKVARAKQAQLENDKRRGKKGLWCGSR
jgi:ribosomal RNA-processing protein 17